LEKKVINKTGNVCIIDTLRRVHVTIGAVGKQWVLFIMSVCF